MFTKIGLFAFVSALALTAEARADIVGGNDVKETDPIRSSTIGLYSPSSDGRSGALCTGSIIGKDMAITAAHCIQPGGRKPVVLFGRDFHSPKTIKRQVVEAKVNPAWARHRGRGMDQGDIALVRFRGGLPHGYKTVGLATSKAAITKGTPVVLAGYGISDARNKSGSGVLRKTRVRVSNPRRGKSEMVLDQSHGHGACHGDSGGPAFINSRGKPVLAGVTNRSFPDNAPDDCAHQVVYTKVSTYRDWINKSEKELRAKHDISAAPFSFAHRNSRSHHKRASKKVP